MRHPTRLDDDQFIAALCESALAAPVNALGEYGRAKHQVALTICDQCRQGWQHGAGVRVAVNAATVARAECDAQWIGHESDAQPSRAYQDIPPAFVRLMWHPDSGRCRTPGCRSARGLELHHIIHRADGGEHAPANLTLRAPQSRTATRGAGDYGFKRSGQRWFETRLAPCLFLRSLHLSARLRPCFEILQATQIASLRAA